MDGKVERLGGTFGPLAFRIHIQRNANHEGWIKINSLQRAGLELGHLATFQSGGFGTEIKTLCTLFFVNERVRSA